MTEGAAREPLSRERVIDAALELADRSGIAGLTIRTLARELGVRPMSLYHHVAGKEQILDGVVDAVFAQMAPPVPGRGWRSELAGRCRSAREVLRRHPWAVGLLDSRRMPGPATLAHHEATIGTLRAAGFDVPAAAQAYAFLDAFVYGFALQESSLPFSAPEEAAGVAEDILAGFASDAYPYLTELAVEHVMRPGYSFAAAFDTGLDLVLDGIARLR